MVISSPLYSQPENLGVAFFATGPGLGLIMCIFTTLEFPTDYFDFHLLTTSVNAKYYYRYAYGQTSLFVGPTIGDFAYEVA